MKRVATKLRVTEADTLSDTLIRIYKDAVSAAPDGLLAKDANLAAMVADVEKFSADITTAIKRDKVSLSLENKEQINEILDRQINKANNA